VGPLLSKGRAARTGWAITSCAITEGKGNELGSPISGDLDPSYFATVERLTRFTLTITFERLCFMKTLIWLTWVSNLKYWAAKSASNSHFTQQMNLINWILLIEETKRNKEIEKDVTSGESDL
jgi:hypothetical protein